MLDSKIQNCFIDASGSKSNLFYVYDGVFIDRNGNIIHDGNLVIANLDDYAVIPKDKYLKLCSTRPVVRIEPRNNDGRVDCFWCGQKTEKRGGVYDVCPKCKK